METAISHRHLPHIYVPGSCYFLTFRLARAQTRHLNEDERSVVSDHIARIGPGLCRAWVVMPDHVHLLYQSTPHEMLSKTLKALKGSSSRTLGKLLGREAPVWQDESFDRVVRNEKDMLSTWQYIEANPVRKDLSTTAEKYRWSSAWNRNDLGG